MDAVQGLLALVEQAMAAIARTIMVAMMLIVSSDVAMRYGLNSPIVGVSELVGLYLMVGLFYFSLSGTFSSGAHIRVDILLPLMSRRTRRACEFLCCLLAAPVFVLIADPSIASAWAAYRRGDVLAGLVPWPTWIPPALVALGCCIMAARLAFDAVAHLVVLLGGRETVALPEISGHQETGA